MQQSLIYNLIKKFPYPFIVRHNRIQVYAQHPEVDYALLWKYSIRCSLVGYIVGKFVKMPWTLALIAPVPLVLKFVYDEYNLKKEGKYQELYRFQNWEVKKKISEMQLKQKQTQATKQKHSQMHTNIALKQNYFGEKVTSTQEFVKRLPKNYF